MKIRDHNRSFEIKQALTIIIIDVCSDYGIAEQHPEQQVRIVEFLLDNYMDLQVPEISRAFEMNASGRTWEAVKPFGEMSKIFIGEVITKYLEWKRIQNQRNPLPPEKQLPISQSEQRQKWFNRQIELMELYGDKYVNLNWTFIYDYAVSCGMFHEPEEVKAVMMKVYQENPEMSYDKRKDEAMRFLFNKYYHE